MIDNTMSTHRLIGTEIMEQTQMIIKKTQSITAQALTEEILFTCRETRLGTLMMAATIKGVCFVMFGDSKAQLGDQLRAEFPNADLTPSLNRSGNHIDNWITVFVNHLNTGSSHSDIPLDLRGTAFQIKVWQYLRTIPEGRVLNYSEVAKAIGNPRAVRATASACGKNRITVLVPCHRVLRSDGGLGGYRWGLERKRQLLDAERQRHAGIRI